MWQAVARNERGEETTQTQCVCVSGGNTHGKRTLKGSLSPLLSASGDPPPPFLAHSGRARAAAAAAAAAADEGLLSFFFSPREKKGQLIVYGFLFQTASAYRESLGSFLICKKASLPFEK